MLNIFLEQEIRQTPQRQLAALIKKRFVIDKNIIVHTNNLMNVWAMQVVGTY